MNGEIYHIYNKTINPFRSFDNTVLCERFINLMKYYRTDINNVSYSKYQLLPDWMKEAIQKKIYVKKHWLIDILAFCLMPNHYHLLLKQKQTNGIITYVANISNAFTRYYNIFHERKGPLFLTQFQSKHVHSVELLLHESRYIHLNPFTAGIVKNFDDLVSYQKSSLKEYIETTNICNTDIVMNYFSYKTESYLNFLKSHAEYQKVVFHIKKANKRRMGFK